MELFPVENVEDVSDIGIKYLIDHKTDLLKRRQNIMDEIQHNNEKVQRCDLNTYHEIQMIRVLFLKKRHLKNLHKMMSEHYAIIDALMDL